MSLGRVIALTSFAQAERQLREHALYLMQKISPSVRTYAHSAFILPAEVHEVWNELLRQGAKIFPATLAQIWSAHFAQHIGWLAQDREKCGIVLTECFYPEWGARAAYELGLRGDHAISFTNQFCSICRDFGFPEVELGIVIGDPRLDVIAVENGRSTREETKLYYHYLQQPAMSIEIRKTLLAQPNWLEITAGKPDLYDEEGPTYVGEVEQYWRDYWEIEVAIACHCLGIPNNFTRTQMELLYQDMGK